KNITARGGVHTFSDRWEPSSFAYNAPLGVYMMAAATPDSFFPFVKPNYIGFWVAPEPWGPWQQIPGETSWSNPIDARSVPFGPEIAPKWIGEAGKSFWMAWSESIAYGMDEPLLQCKTKEEFIHASREWGESSPYYAFNAQHVDLI